MTQDFESTLLRLGEAQLDPVILQRFNELGQDSRDQLTGLPDCRSFSFQLQQRICTSESYGIVATSIDHLQELNLISGWVVGDIAICTYARMFEQLPIDGALAGRTGGCTFMIYFPCRDSKLIRDWLRRASAFVKLLDVPGLDVFPEGHLTMSAGIYLSDGVQDASRAMMEAERRLACAQGQGGARASLLPDGEICIDQLAEHVKVAVRRPEAIPWHEGHVCEVSLQGVAFDCGCPFMVREEVVVWLEFRQKVTLEIPGQVVWRKTQETNRAGTGFALGVRFNDLALEHRELIENFLTGGE